MGPSLSTMPVKVISGNLGAELMYAYHLCPISKPKEAFNKYKFV